jgi:hypothetical protein
MEEKIHELLLLVRWWCPTVRENVSDLAIRYDSYGQ